MLVEPPLAGAVRAANVPGARPLEFRDVDCVDARTELVAARDRLDQVVSEVTAERRDVALQRLGCSRRRVVAPQCVDQVCGAHERPRGAQHREDRAVFRNIDVEDLAIVGQYDRTERSHLHVDRSCVPAVSHRWRSYRGRTLA